MDICEGDSLFIGTSIYTQSGIYLDSLSYFTYDCDSLILATELHILEVERIINDTLIRRGEYFNNILILQDTTVIDTLTGNNGCDSLSILNITTTTVSTSADPITDFNVRLFPNPVQQELKIQLEGDVPPTIHLRLLNLHGKILQMFEAKNQRELSFSMHGIPVGIYLLELKGKDFYKTYRIIKKAK